MGGIELPQLGEGLFQRAPDPSERNSPLLGDLIVENVDGSAMKVKIARHLLCIAPHESHAQRCALLQRVLALSSGSVHKPSGLLWPSHRDWQAAFRSPFESRADVIC